MEIKVAVSEMGSPQGPYAGTARTQFVQKLGGMKINK